MRRVVAYSLASVLAFSCVLFVGHSGYQRVRAQSAAPQIKRIGPDLIIAGSPTFTIRVIGNDFASGAKVLFDGVALESSRVVFKDKLLLAEVDSSLVSSAGTHTVQVVNPDGMTSSSVTLTVENRDPELRIRLGGNAVQEGVGSSFEFDVTGEGFEEGSVAVVWGEDSPRTTYISPTAIRIQIPFNFATDPARIPIFVRNKGGHYSNVEIFFIVPRPVRLSSVDPETIEVGTEDFEIEVNAGATKEGARINVNGISLETTAKKNGRLVATVPGSLRSQPGLLTVRVEQEGLQSDDFTIIVAPDEEPFIFAVGPARIRIGEKKPTIEIAGANLGDNSVVLIDGEEVKVRSSTRRRLTVLVPSSLLSSPGTHTVQVKDEENRVSNVATFEVVPDSIVTTLAGSAREGFNQSCVSLEQARFRRPRRLAVGPDGLLYVTDQQNHSIRTINVDTGTICTIAGTGLSGYHDSNNPAGKQPTFSYPNGIAVAADGTIFVTENGNNVVRRIRRTGGSITVDTFAGESNVITSVDRQNRLNSTRNGIDGFRDGPANDAAFRLPDDIQIAPDGTLYVADPNNHAIRRIRFNGGQVVVNTLAGNGVPGFADGDAANARFNTPTALAVSDDGNFLYVADTNNFRIRRINLLTNRVETYAGTGEFGNIDGPAKESTFRRPIGLALDSDGTLYISEVDGNQIRFVDPSGNVGTLAGASGVVKFRDGAGLRATFNGPRGIAIDRQRGVLYVADYENFRIRSIALR